ncbi:MAG: glycosyltransferase [Pseudonocardiales bacterium]|nr:glycosyltransferase [Pseudonocardiales bacterium]MBV9651220.1 glycosyltransferase [Pseudonocardiales bacterium]
MNVLHWHVHGSWSTAFVHGPHTYLVPVTPDRDADGRGRARTFDWPPNAVEITPAALASADIDVVVLQRPHELQLVQQWLGRRPGRDVPAVYVEHNTPGGDVPSTRHPMADQFDIPVVHVTPFNDVFWDCGRAPTVVIEHGIPDPGYQYTGDIPHAAVVINEPVRRGRVTGTDLLPRFAGQAALDVFGMAVSQLPASDRITTFEDLPQARMHTELARRRVYLHPIRWTSLGLSLLEAMHLGMPVVALGTTEVAEAVPPDAGVISTRIDRLASALRTFIADPDLAQHAGVMARTAARRRYSLDRFCTDWDQLFKEVSR